jgi:hypothetical protein
VIHLTRDSLERPDTPGWFTAKEIGMTRTTLMVAVALAATLGTTAYAERGGRQAEPLAAPENVTCGIDVGAMLVDVMWDAVVSPDADKYAVDFECEDPTGTIEMDVEYEPEEQLTELSAAVPFDTFPLEVILEGDGAWTCVAKVKGLNPPGRKQSHLQGVALCE